MVANAYSRRPVHAGVVRERGPFGRVASLAARFAVALLIATVAARWLGLVALDEMVTPITVSAVAVAFGLAMAVLALADAWLRGVSGGWVALRALALAAVAAIPLALLAQRGLAREPMLDLTTDPVEPPRLIGVVADPDVPVGSASGLATRRYEATIERVSTAVSDAILESGWPIDVTQLLPAAPPERVTATPETDGEAIPVPRMRPLTEAERAVRDAATRAELEALADQRREQEAVVLVGGRLTSPVLRIPTVVAVRLRDDGDSTAVDVRVRLAEGTHDLGETERRARDFLDALDAASARAGVR